MFIVLWIFLSGVAASIAQNKGRNGGNYFLLSIIFSPLIGVIAALAAQQNDAELEKRKLKTGKFKRCVQCSEIIRSEAQLCKHCRSEQPPFVVDRSLNRRERIGRRILFGLLAFIAFVVISIAVYPKAFFYPVVKIYDWIEGDN